MRRSTIVLTALLAALALSAGALAYPAVVGRQSVSSTGSVATTPRVGHPAAGDDNETAPPVSPAPEANETQVNETENVTGNESETTNVTVTQDNATTWINGTIVVTIANETVVNLTFSVDVEEGQGANVTFNGAFMDNGTDVRVGGTAFMIPDERLVYVHATYTLTRDGLTLASRDLAFQLSWPEGSTALATPMAGMIFALTLAHE